MTLNHLIVKKKNFKSFNNIYFNFNPSQSFETTVYIIWPNQNDRFTSNRTVQFQNLWLFFIRCFFFFSISLYKWSYWERKVVTTFYITCKSCLRVTPEKVWELNLHHHHGNWMWRSLSYHIITMIIIITTIITVNHVLSLSVALFANPVTVSIVIPPFFLSFSVFFFWRCVRVRHRHRDNVSILSFWDIITSVHVLVLFISLNFFFSLSSVLLNKLHGLNKKFSGTSHKLQLKMPLHYSHILIHSHFSFFDFDFVNV